MSHQLLLMARERAELSEPAVGAAALMHIARVWRVPIRPPQSNYWSRESLWLKRSTARHHRCC